MENFLVGSSFSKNMILISQLPREKIPHPGRTHFYFPSNSYDPLSMKTSLDEHLFLISSDDPWYMGIFLSIFIHKNSDPHLSRDDHCHISPSFPLPPHRICPLSQGGRHNSLSCLTIEEEKKVLNDFHNNACGGHLSNMSTVKKVFGWLLLAHLCFMTASMLSSVVTSVNYMLTKPEHHLLLSIPS
jgi:hypothetical protein